MHRNVQQFFVMCRDFLPVAVGVHIHKFNPDGFVWKPSRKLHMNFVYEHKLFMNPKDYFRNAEKVYGHPCNQL